MNDKTTAAVVVMSQRVEYHQCMARTQEEKKACPRYALDVQFSNYRCVHEGGLWAPSVCGFGAALNPARYCRNGYKICPPDALRHATCYLRSGNDNNINKGGIIEER